MGFLHAVDAFGGLLTFRTPLFCAVGYWSVLVSIQANVGTCWILVARQLRLGSVRNTRAFDPFDHVLYCWERSRLTCPCPEDAASHHAVKSSVCSVV